MRVDRTPIGEQLHDGEVVEARPAATLILMRNSPSGPEVLLVKRNPEQKFMGGAWVFPGGAVQEGDTGPEAAALRELEEEAGIAMSDPGALVPFSRWITPEEVTVRFDTFFYVAAAPDGAEAKPDGEECVEARWVRPATALEESARDELLLVFPTIKNLEPLREFGTVEEALAAVRSQEVTAIQPRVVVSGDRADIFMPGEPGYDG